MKKTKANIIGQFDGIIQSIEEKYKTSIIDGQDLDDNKGEWLSTTLGLDIALGGGIREGNVVQIASNSMTGKTTLCLDLLTQAQHKYKKLTVFCDAEGRLKPELLNCIEGLVHTPEQEKETGIPRLRIMQSTQDKILTSEDWFSIIRDFAVQCPGCVIVLDSVAALVSGSNITSEIGSNEGGMTKVQKQLYELLRLLSQILHANKSTLIIISHLQSNPGGYGAALRIYGGKALEYFASYRLVAYSSEEVPAGNEEKTGRITKFKVLKNATKPPVNEVPVYIRYGYGIDKERELVELGKAYGFITAKGSWYSMTGKSGEEIKCQGIDNLCDHLRQHKDEAAHLDDSIRKLFLTNEIRNSNHVKVQKSKTD